MAAIKGKCLVTFTRVSNRTSTPCSTRSRQNEKLELKVFHVSRYVTRYQIPRFHAPNNGTMYRFTSQTLLYRVAASIFIGSSIGKGIDHFHHFCPSPLSSRAKFASFSSRLVVSHPEHDGVRCYPCPVPSLECRLTTFFFPPCLDSSHASFSTQSFSSTPPIIASPQS